MRSAISAELQLNFLEAKNRELNSFNSRGSRVGLVAPFGSHVSDLVPPPRMFSDPSACTHSPIINMESESINRHLNNSEDICDQEMTEYPQPMVSSSLPKRSALKQTRFGSYPIPSGQMNSYSLDVRSSPKFSHSLHSSNPLSHNSTQITLVLVSLKCFHLLNNVASL